MSKVSVLIPARQEPQLTPTVQDCLKQATGDIEVLVALDGCWPTEFVNDPRVHYLHWGEARGLRPSLNAAVEMSSGEFLFKLDAHCSVAEGFDLTLKAACEESDVVVPAKYSLDAPTWTRFRSPWHYFYLKWPWEPQADGSVRFVGLQDKNYDSAYSTPRESVRVDDILSYQGSAWMLRRAWWNRILPDGMNPRYYYAQEPQEVGLTTWMSGGRCRIVKDTWYAHLWKGSGANKRLFSRERAPWDAATRWSCRQWMRHPQFPALIERFGPLPGWPPEWAHDARRRRYVP